jgi:hypothetical protein
VAEGVLLDALAAQVELLAGQGDDVERVHDRDRLGQLLGRGVLVAAEPVHRHDPHTVAESLVAGAQPTGQRRRGAAGDHVEQPGGPVTCDHVGEAGDHRDEPVGVGAEHMRPLVLIDPDHLHPVQPGRAGGQQQLAGRGHGDAVPTAMLFTVSQLRPRSRATAVTLALSTARRRRMNAAQRRVVEAPGRASRLLSWAKTSRTHPSWTYR